MSAPGFESAIAFLALGVFVGLDNTIGNLDENRLQVRTSPGDAGRFHFAIALVIAGAAARPGNKMLGRRKHGHIRTNLGKDCNSSHRITRKAGYRPNQVKLDRVRLAQAKDFLFHIFLMCANLINVAQAFPEFCGLLVAYGSVNGGLNLFNRMLAAFVDEGCNIEFLARVFQNVADDGTRGFSKHVRKHIVQLQVGNGEAIERTVLFTGEYTEPRISDKKMVASKLDCG